MQVLYICLLLETTTIYCLCYTEFQYQGEEFTAILPLDEMWVLILYEELTKGVLFIMASHLFSARHGVRNLIMLWIAINLSYIPFIHSQCDLSLCIAFLITCLFLGYTP
jgi:hypothetical protein